MFGKFQTMFFLQKYHLCIMASTRSNIPGAANSTLPANLISPTGLQDSLESVNPSDDVNNSVVKRS